MAKKDKKGGSGSRLKKKAVAQQLVDLFNEFPEKEYDVKDLFAHFKASNHPAKMIVMDALNDLVLDDYVTSDGQGHYRNAVRSNVMEGTFVRKRNGRNSFVPDDGGKSILVCERNSLHALDGDRVRVTMLARRAGHTREAEVTEILERANDTFVGQLQVERGYGFLVTESRSLANDIFIPKDKLNGGQNGDKAVVKIIEWPSDSKSPIGKVVDILGKQGENNAEMHAILAQYGLPYTYPEKVEKAAEKLSPDITPEEIARREDFREVTTFTIDPHDAKDFDDALSIRQLQKGLWEVGVHIADVSHYVKEGDIIDKEAVKRATSVYLVDRTIPMLPERLCNFICSLRPDEEKLAYSTIFHINDKGEIKDWHLAHTVIKSNRRFTYEEVQTILERNGVASEADLNLPGEHPEPLPAGAEPEGEYAAELIQLDKFAKILRAKRFKNGSIGFDRSEVRFEVDEKGHPISTYVKVAKDANKLVEEFMLLANRSVAQMIAVVPRGRKPKVFVYRIHDVPDPEKMEKLSGFVARFGYKIRTEGTKTEVSKSLNRLLSDIKGKKEEEVVEMVALRAMMKARYSTHNIGHYGLMFDYYTHFTSPIRRYPDTMVHRLLTRYAEGGRSVSQTKYEDLCEHASNMEQLAATAERASIKYKQVEFMADRIGQEFDGTVSGVTEFGLYVEITENSCEGMVPLRLLLDDYYEFDERNFCLVGRRYRKRYSLGDKVRIRVERANLERRQLDFALVGDEGGDIKPEKAAKSGGAPVPLPEAKKAKDGKKNYAKKNKRPRAGRAKRAAK
ncbi:ribonuclease R [uncultured Prevotellamassilia sp.]|uniref:ribonuclease R n=1 Tax=uncultured Prevotellamassilia sp. TaxID=1926676 RepID=UPI0025896924|nr:ribonuclease R [uncultured Prevotellamassilia sp.]